MLLWCLRLICLKPVEESYDKGSAFKLFKFKKSSRAVGETAPFKHSKSGGNSKVVHPLITTHFNHVFSCRYEM